jgi:hypothetical protein
MRALTKRNRLQASFETTTAALTIALASWVSGCGDSAANRPWENDCPSGTAQIRIADGWSEVLCGCQSEPAGTVAIAPQPLTCTVAAGTRVLFRYESAQTPHQIASAPGASSSFRAGPPAFPDQPDTLAPFPVELPTPGNYEYVDLFSPEQIRGTIVVL